jgi:ABC-type transport system substrate-binding protein
VRKAMSMLIDRDLWIDTFYGVSDFAKDGLPLETRWHSHVFAGEEAWLDPRARDLGETAVFFKHDPGEARKLLRAAGHTSAVPGDYTYSTAPTLGADFPRMAEVLRQMFQANGDFDLRVNNPSFNDLNANYSRTNGNFSGMVMSAQASITDIDQYLYPYFHSSGSLRNFPQGDTEMDRLINAQRRETDKRKRAEIIKQFQKYAATKFYTMLAPGHALGYELSWPWYGNRLAFNGWDIHGLPQEVNVHAWYDKANKQA